MSDINTIQCLPNLPLKIMSRLDSPGKSHGVNVSPRTPVITSFFSLLERKDTQEDISKPA